MIDSINFIFSGYIILFSFVIGFFVGILCGAYQDHKKIQTMWERNRELQILLQSKNIRRKRNDME